MAAVSASLSTATAPPSATRRLLLLPGRAHSRLVAMCGREGDAMEEVVAGWARAVYSLAALGPPASARARTRPRREGPLEGRPAEDSLARHRSTFGTWPPDLTWDRTVLAAVLQRPSAFDAELDDEPPRRYTLQVDDAALLRFAGPGRRLVASWTTGGPKRYAIARNLALSIRQNCGPALERIFVLVALDRDAFDRAQAEGFQAVLNEGSTDLKDDIWKMRWLIQTTFLSLGLEVLVVDSDIVFLRDPFEHFYFDADQEVMTDHFFPKEQLWATWLRPAEHINTGFIFARPSPTLIAHLVEFLDRNYYEHFDKHLIRDGMDQRVYNRFVMEKFEADPPGVFAVYEDRFFEHLDWQRDPSRTNRFTPKDQWQPRDKGWGLVAGGRRVKIRLLDPAEIAHGMNYFWRRAHHLRPRGSLGGQQRPPAVAHVNGVDPKLYFLRDRDVWYIDDWDERFGDSPYFMTYHHPGGLSLRDDFEHLMAAIEVAAYFRRRVVLPDTMNCANSPAYEVWRMNETLQGQGCTYDYFAHANGLYEVYSRTKPFCVEAGLARTARFRALLRSSSRELPGFEELRLSGELREEVLSLQGRPAGTAAFGTAQVLQLPAEMDVRVLRNALRHGDFGFRMNPQRVFSCAYQQMLPSAMACLDETYIEEFGNVALKMCEAMPQGCGPVGVCCCWPFWGYGEKLQYFTGVPWNLPCNCGLDLCQGYDRNTSDGSGWEHCCRHMGDTSLYPQLDEGVFPCRELAQWQGPTAGEDAHTYSAAALSDFLKGKRTAKQTFATCRRDRTMRRGDFYREASLRECTLQVSAFLLREEAVDRAKVWWDWLLQERRGLGNETLLIFALDGNGTQMDNTHFTLPKLQHDAEQLAHLAAGGFRSYTASGSTPWRNALDRDWLVAEVVPAYEALLRTFEAFAFGSGQREEVMAVFPGVRPFFNRALYVPDVRLPLGEAAVDGRDGRRSVFTAAARALREEGVAVLDDLLAPGALGLARELLADSTVWYATEAGGVAVKAHLNDGLHAELGLQIVRELRESWLKDILGAQPLRDAIALKWEPSAPGPGLLPRCEDGVVAMALWVAEGPGDDAASTGNGLRVYNASVPLELAVRSAWGAEGAEDEVRRLLRSAASRRVAYRANRAVLWRAAWAHELLWAGGAAWPDGYARRRVDWLFSFGRSRLWSGGPPRQGGFVPSLEGRADSWGGHYYAQDHDHR